MISFERAAVEAIVLDANAVCERVVRGVILDGSRSVGLGIILFMDAERVVRGIFD